MLRRLEWRVLRRLDGRLQGDYRTVFRGTGVDVADLREYQYGDDLRHIDWNVTARTDITHVREYVEDREVTAWLLLDASASMDFGPVERRKHLVLTEVAATVAQLLSRGGNRVGALFFDGARAGDDPARQRPQPRAAHPRPDAGRAAAGRAGHHRPRCRAARRAGDPAAALARRDRLGLPQRAGLAGAARASSPAATTWWPIQVVDRREFELPAAGMIYVEDAETGEVIFVDTDDPGFQQRLRAQADERQATLVADLRSAGLDLFTVSTDEDLVRALFRISQLRRRRRP